MYITSHSIRIVLLPRYVNIYYTMAPMSRRQSNARIEHRRLNSHRECHLHVYCHRYIERLTRCGVNHCWSVHHHLLPPVCIRHCAPQGIVHLNTNLNAHGISHLNPLLNFPPLTPCLLQIGGISIQERGT